MKLKFAVASLLAAASMGAFAADQVVTLNASGITYFHAVTTPTEGLFAGGSDQITFNSVTPGTYNIYIALSGQNVDFNAANTTLNGKHGVWDSEVGRFAYLGVEATETSPFVLDLAGSVRNFATAPGYNGSVTIAPVPEPTTYGMLLGGLGIMGFLARRKAKKA